MAILWTLLTFIPIAFGCAGPRQATVEVTQTTVPLVITNNRPLVDLTFERPNGSKRLVRFLIDSGGGGFLINEKVARDVGLRCSKTIKGDHGIPFGKPDVLPKVFVGEMPLSLTRNRTLVILGADDFIPEGADGLLPGHVLARYHAVFDYPNATFTLARSGVLQPRGKVLPMPVSKGSGFPRTEIEVDGITYGVLLDTGASFTMVSEVLLKSWGGKHPEWPRYQGAFGEAKTLGGQTLETMFIPSAKWGSFQLQEVGITSQREGTFEKWMSGMMTAPIVGSLAGNVLKQFRVELDYPNQKLYLSKP